MELAKSKDTVHENSSSSKDNNPFFSFNKKQDFASPFFQAKLAVNAPGDMYEKEADAVAEKVMRTPASKIQSPVKGEPGITSFALAGSAAVTSFTPTVAPAATTFTSVAAPTVSQPQIQREEVEGKEEEQDPLLEKSLMRSGGRMGGGNDELNPNGQVTGIINRKENNGEPVASTASVEKTINSPGEAIQPEVRSFMEERFGHDFSDVQIHNNSEAHKSSADINALAYTHQNHIVFGAGQYQPGTNTGKHLLAHELTHVIQQQHSGASIQRKPGDKSTPLPSFTAGDPATDIGYLLSAFGDFPALGSLQQVLIVTGTTARLYNVKTTDKGFDKTIAGSYTIRPLGIPAYYFVALPNNKLGILGTQETEGANDSPIVDNVVIDLSRSTKEERELYEKVDKELTIPDWFLTPADRKDYESKLVAGGFAVIIEPSGVGAGKAEEAGKETVPPQPTWMPGWQKEMQKLIKETREKDPESTDIPDIFKFYYSKRKAKWTALASATLDNKKAEVYLDINEKDDKQQKLTLIRDKIRIKQLSPDESATKSKEAKELEEEYVWAYRIKKEIDKKITEERAKFPSSADLPDKTAIVFYEEFSGRVFLKLSAYVIESDVENKPTQETRAKSVLRTGVLPQPLSPGTSLDQLFTVVKQATLAIRGQSFKPTQTNPEKAEKVLEAFPASISVAAGREDFKTVTGASLDMHMSLNMSAVEGINTTHLTSIAYRGIYYTWDVYRLSDIITSEEKKSLESDWLKQRGQLLQMLKDSSRLTNANPVINKEKLKEVNDAMERIGLPKTDVSKPFKGGELRDMRNAGITYGSSTKLTPDASIKLPSEEGDYVVYCRAVTEPEGKVFRMPSEAFYPIKVVGGHELAEQSRDASLEEINELKKELAAEEDEEKKKKLSEKIGKLKDREKLTLKERTNADAGEVARTKELALRLIHIYQKNVGKKVSIPMEIEKQQMWEEDAAEMFQIWYTVETTSPQTPPVEKLQKMIKQLDVQAKGLDTLKKSIGDFSGDIAGYKDGMYTPVSSLVSKVTGEVYNLITMLAVRSDKDGGTSVILVDVTSRQTQAKYDGHSALPKDEGGLEAAIVDAYTNFGKNCKYGEGYIAYRVPGTNIFKRADSKPGFKAQVLEYLGYIAMAAGLAALVIGTVATGGAAGVAAFALGIGAGIIGAGLSVHNIYDRRTNHRFEWDVETAMDALNIIGPFLQGLTAATKISKLGQIAKIKDMVKAGSVTEKTAETMGAFAKASKLMRLERAFTIIQKTEALVNLSLVGYKTFVDLCAISEAYKDDPKKRTAMQWEVMKNAALAGTIALVGVASEFKPNSAHLTAWENIVARGAKEQNYIKLMMNSGMIDAQGKWIDPAVAAAEAGLVIPKETTEPGAGDAKPDIKPIEADAKPIEPEVKPVEPEVKPVEPEVKPVEPEVKPVEPDAASKEATAKPVDKEPAPIKPIDEAADSAAKAETADPIIIPEKVPVETPVPAQLPPAAKAKKPQKTKKPAQPKGPKTPKEKIPVLLIDTAVPREDGSTTTLRRDGSLLTTSKIGKGPGRAHYEKRMLSGIKVGLPGWHRAHAQGQGTGSESPHGIFYAPPEVNLAYQNSGIEARIREIFRITPPEYQLTLTTITKPHPTKDGMPSRRLASIEYRIEISEPGQTRKYLVLEAGLKVEDSITKPKVETSAESFAADAFLSIRYPDSTPPGMSPRKFEALRKQVNELEKQLNEMIERVEKKMKTSKGGDKVVDQVNLENLKAARESLYKEDYKGVNSAKDIMEEAVLWYPKEPLISVDAQGYLNTWRGKINQGSKDHIKRLLELSGSWKDLVKKLQADPKANKTTLKILEKYRNNIINRLKKKYNADTLKNASTEAGSDIDLNVKGENAGANIIKAEAEMKEEFGDNWSDLLHLNFYSEGERLLRYTTVGMDAGATKAFEKELTRKTIQLSLAKMLQSAKGHPGSSERVHKLIDMLAPTDLAAIKSLADTDPATMLKKRDEFHAQADALQKELNNMDTNHPDRVKKAKELTLLQMEINFYTKEAYMGPGALMESAAISNNPVLKMQKIVGNLELMEHVLAKANGNILKAMKEYEMYKYMYRVSDAMQGAQTDLFYDYLTKQIYKVNREGAESMAPGQLQGLYKDFMQMTNDYLAAEIKNIL